MRPATSPLLGAVLAGGTSSRFGRDKALVRVGGESLLHRQVRLLAEVCDDVVIVSSSEAHDLAGHVRIPDPRPGMGPLAGIEGALAHGVRNGHAAVFVAACDAPACVERCLRPVIAAIGGRAAAAPERVEPPGFEPLCAVYRTRCLSEVARLLDRGVRAAHRLLPAVEGHVVPTVVPCGDNLNTPEDLERYERRRSGRSDIAEKGVRR